MPKSLVPMAKIRMVMKRVLLLSCITIVLKVLINHFVPITQLTSRTDQGTNTLEKRHIGFLKIHKAASSTLQNIFIRYGLSRNLTFVIPSKKEPPFYSNVISTFQSITKEDIEPAPQGKQFDILCHHVIYDVNAWKNILPADSVLIGSVRDPISHFSSTLKYFHPPYIEKIDSPDKVRTFLEHPHRYEIPVPFSSTNNRMSFEFGVNDTIIWSRDRPAFLKYVQNVIAKQFELIVVTEKFDESLILLKRKLNWSLKDIIYEEKNGNFDGSTNEDFDEKTLTLLSKHNILDFLLYGYFNDRLKQQIATEQKTEFQDELNTFRKIRELVLNYCYSKDKAPSFKVNATKWNGVFYWTKEECDVLMQDELALTELLRNNQKSVTSSIKTDTNNN